MSIRIGMIGSGIVTQKAHIPAIITDPRFQVTAICRRNIEKLKPLQVQFPHAKIYSGAKDLIESGEVDCVLVAADVDVHLSIAQIALDNNLYVLLEKPVDSFSDNIKNFISTNSDKINKIMIAFNKRFYPGIMKLDELRQSEELSNLIGGTMSFLTQQGSKEGRAGVLQNLIHYCDLVCWIFGKPTNVFAHFSSVLNDDREGKTISSTILTERGCSVNLFFTSSSNWKVPIHERIEVLDDKKNKLYIENTDKVVFTKFNNINDVKNLIFGESNSIFWRRSPFGYDAQISRFGDLVEGKLAYPSPDLNDALNAQLLFEKIFEYDK